jgi:hypothetical protein
MESIIRIEIGIVALLLTVGLVGCGGNDGGSSVASANGSASSPTSSASAGSGSEQDQLLRYARCLREHGVPNFPDPDEDGELSVDPAKPDLQAVGATREQVLAAQEKCRPYLPNGGELQREDPPSREQGFALARCMREHGVPNFPDPDEDGGFALDGLGIDPDGPAMRAAQQACGVERGRTVPPGATVHD